MSQPSDEQKDQYTDQLAAFALGALDGDELTTLEAHLRSCPDCAARLEELRRVADALSVNSDPQPPAGHRQRFLAKLNAVIKFGSPAPPGSEPPRTHITPKKPPLRFGRWTTGLLIGLTLVFAVLWLATAHRHADAAAQLGVVGATVTALAEQRDQLAAIVSNPASESLRLNGAVDLGDAAVQLWLDPDSDQGVLVASNLPAAPDGKLYELWLIGGDDPQAVDTFQTRVGEQTLLFFNSSLDSLAGYEAAITAEVRRETTPNGAKLLSSRS